MPLSTENVIGFVETELEALGGKVKFFKGKYCGGAKNKCVGLFYIDCKGYPVIKVAKGKQTEAEWLGVLLHEYNHLTQWRDNIPVWEKFCEQDGSCHDMIENPKKNKKALLDLMALELDCEKKTCYIIKDNKLFCHKEYIQMANAVLYKYAFLIKHNYWPKEGRIKDLKVWKSCRTTLRPKVADYLNIPAKLENIFLSRD